MIADYSNNALISSQELSSNAGMGRGCDLKSGASFARLLNAKLSRLAAPGCHVSRISWQMRVERGSMCERLRDRLEQLDEAN